MASKSAQRAALLRAYREQLAAAHRELAARHICEYIEKLFPKFTHLADLESEQTSHLLELRFSRQHLASAYDQVYAGKVIRRLERRLHALDKAIRTVRSGIQSVEETWAPVLSVSARAMASAEASAAVGAEVGVSPSPQG